MLRRDSAPWHARGQTLDSALPPHLLAGRGVCVKAFTRFGARYVDHTVTAPVPRTGRRE